jgi:hypothetical protein
MNGLTTRVIAAALLATGATAALAEEELENNHPIQSAQRLTIPPSGSITINGVIGNLSGPAVQDVDFYAFWGKAGDTVEVDIDGGMGGARNVDTWVGIFGPGWQYVLRASNDDAPGPLDPGSIHRFDSRIPAFTLDEDGVWTIGVSSYPRRLTHGGAYVSTTLGSNSNGDYSLAISGLTPLIQQVGIEVKPGNGGVAPVNPKARGTVPVALLSSADFNALDVNVDPKTLTFGRTGAEESLRRCGKDGEDVNGDGRQDLVCHFENQAAAFTEDDDRGTVRGITRAGMPFEGHGMLKVVPVKRRE